MASEQEIRELVRRVVDSVLAEGEPRDPSPRAASGSEAVAIGGDHGGFRLKEALREMLAGRGLEVVDCGTHSEEACDYPDIAHAVAEKVASGACRWGILVDGAGIGSAMTANKVPGVRAALCYDLSSARNSREHNHANVLTLGAGLIGVGLARQIVETWLDTPWGGDRHARRVAKIDAVEAKYAKSECSCR